MAKTRNEIVESVRNFCLKYRLISRGDKILCAVSGGPDSMALLHILMLLCQEIECSLSIAHVEHGLRGNASIEDQKFVQTLASTHGIKFYTKNIDVMEQKVMSESVEEAARRLRFAFLYELREREGYDKIATGHTLDDRVETSLFRLFMGCGPKGFIGIKPKSGYIIRPLLGISKKSILDYLEQEKISYRIDMTNYNVNYMRNRLRHTVMLNVADINPKFKEHVVNLINILDEENEILDSLVEDKLKNMIIASDKNKVSIDYGKFEKLPRALKRRIVLKVLRKLWQSLFEKQFYIPYTALDKLAGQPFSRNKTLYRNNEIEIRLIYGNLIFKKRVVDNLIPKYLYFVKEDTKILYIREIKRKIRFCVSDLVKTYKPNTLYLDLDRLTFPLIIRNRRNGDKLKVQNNGEKKIKEILIDDKVDPFLRNEIPIVSSGGKIAGIFSWYYGKPNRISEDYKIIDSTVRVLQCSLE